MIDRILSILRQASRSASMLAAALLLALGLAPPAFAAPPAITERGYVLGPNDAITVAVFGQQEFNVATKVKSDGSITMPLIGKLPASGQTAVSLAAEVGRRLTAGNFLKDPIVNVEVTEYNSRWVRVAGKVGQPGLVPLDRNYRVLDVLLRTGWVQDAGASYVMLRRAADGRETTISTLDLARGDPDKDPMLEAGDTIYVPEADVVFISGQINRPGAFPLKPGMTVRSLLATAGGVTQLGSDNKVKLARGGKEISADASTTLQKDDVVTVKERLF